MRWLIGCLVLLLCSVVVPQSQATSMRLGENFLGGGQSVGVDLAAYGGSVWNTYYQSPVQDGEPNRVRLLRYPWLSVTQAQVSAMSTKGLTWMLGNEVNNGQQDGGMQDGNDATPFVQWYHSQASAIRGADPTARIAGPSTFGWTAAMGLTTGQSVYDRLWATHVQLYGTAPDMQIVNLHYYPSGNWFYNMPWAEKQLYGEVNGAADWAQAHGKDLAISEWSYWTQNFDSNCSLHPQTNAERYHYVQNGLQIMANRGVLFALFFGNVQQACDDNGHAAWLFDNNGVLTVEGQAHRDFVRGGGTVLTSTPVMVTNTVVPTNTSTMVPTVTPTTMFTRTATPLVLTLTPTTVPTTVPTLTYTPKPVATVPTKTSASGCTPTFIKKC